MQKVSRDVKILKIAQSHVAPNMSLEKQRAIFQQFDIFDNGIPGLDRASDEVLDQIIKIITAIVKGQPVLIAAAIAPNNDGRGDEDRDPSPKIKV